MSQSKHHDAVERVVNNIRRLPDMLNEPEKWRVLIPETMYENVISKLDTTEDLGRHYKGISLCYSNYDTNTKIEYRGSLADFLNEGVGGSDE